MDDGLESVQFYQNAIQLWELCWNDTERLQKDFRGKEIAKQLIRACGSISANIEEGYGRGFGKEYPHFLRIARGSAQETKGWYRRAKCLLSADTIEERDVMLNGIIAMITKSIKTLERKKK